MKTLISVVIVTRNRHEQLFDCLNSLSKSTFTNFELIVVDQSKNTFELSKISIFKKFKKSLYLHKYEKGKSKGLNKAISVASGRIIVFTDDDCIASENWLSSIVMSFKKNQEVAAVFGMTKPYQPELNKKATCPSTFIATKPKKISKLCRHWINIGYGNNMSIKKKALISIGAFNELLGPGSLGSNAEDADVALRLIKNNYTIQYDPNCITFHNRWLSNREEFEQRLSYITGEVSCYKALALQGSKLATRVVEGNFTYVLNKRKKIIKSLLRLEKDSLTQIGELILFVLAILRGLLTAHVIITKQKVANY